MSDSNSKEQIVDFGEARKKKLEEKRRKTERIFFRHILGVYSVVENEKLRSIEIVDMSDDGLAFQVPFDPVDPWPKDADHVQLRLYFSQDTYLPISVNVKNSRPSINDGVRYVQYGCEVDSKTQSYEAFKQFVQFLRLYSEHSHKDNGDMTLFYV